MQLPVFDALGNPTELRREDGVLIEHYEYTPFGGRSATAGVAKPWFDRFEPYSTRLPFTG